MHQSGIVVLALLATTVVAACEGKSSVRTESETVNRAQTQLLRNQPVPTFDWSLDRHIVIEVYKARQRAVATYSYVRSPFTGKVLFSCPSIGFPIPADTQLTNPLQYYANGGVVEQAEPNGLYTSKNTRGTYVACTTKTGKIAVAYFEEDVEAYVQPMREENGILVPAGEPTFLIDPERK